MAVEIQHCRTFLSKCQCTGLGIERSSINGIGTNSGKLGIFGQVLHRYSHGSIHRNFNFKENIRRIVGHICDQLAVFLGSFYIIDALSQLRVVLQNHFRSCHNALCGRVSQIGRILAGDFEFHKAVRRHSALYRPLAILINQDHGLLGHFLQRMILAGPGAKTIYILSCINCNNRIVSIQSFVT